MQPIVQLQPLFPSSFNTGWTTVKEPVLGQHHAALLPLTVEPFCVSDPFEDSLEASLTWGKRVERVEREEVARAMAPVLAPPALSVLRRVAFQHHSNSTDCRPILKDLDVITAVRGI